METIESERNRPATVIRAQVAVRCRALNLTPERQAEAENEALDLYWKRARSIAMCVATGVRKAHELAKVQA
jgi:hypothetical protein